jgi:hypothetical protein
MSVIKFCLDEPVTAEDLRGYAPYFDRALDLADAAQPLDPAIPDSTLIGLLRDLGVGAETLAQFEPQHVDPSRHLRDLQQLLAATVLTTNKTPLLVSIREGFLQRADESLVLGTPDREALTSEYFRGKDNIAQTLDHLEECWDRGVDRTSEAYMLLRRAVEALFCEDSRFVETFVAWVCGNASLPPERPMRIKTLNPLLFPDRLPSAHTCTATIDLCMPRYNRHSEEERVLKLVADLQLVTEHSAFSLDLA